MQPSEAWKLTYREFSALMKYRKAVIESDNKPEMLTKADAERITAQAKANHGNNT